MGFSEAPQEGHVALSVATGTPHLGQKLCWANVLLSPAWAPGLKAFPAGVDGIYASPPGVLRAWEPLLQPSFLPCSEAGYMKTRV